MKGLRGAASLAGWWEGFAGLSRDGFFGLPGWVDSSKPAGHTSQVGECGPEQTLKSIRTLNYFFFSPNLIWFVITLVLHVCFPYELEAAAAGFAWGWVGRLTALNFAVGFAYYGFFYWALYTMHWAKRKFQPGTYPTVGNMVHNIWYWSLGVVHWSLVECSMLRLWANGKVPYVSDGEVLTSPWQMAVMAFWILAVPIWRDHHFYVAHRFIHVRALYRYVHSLHHRNADPEPFSGMTMHPVEHLFYFSVGYIPTLYLRSSTLVFRWIMVHAALAPGAGHSGWEDHWQADQYHYVHHAKFECNYGSPGTGWLDQLLGTFREKLGSSDAYRGEYKDRGEDKGDKGEKKVWAAQSYLGLQSGDHLAYTVFCLVATAFLFWAAGPNQQSPAPLDSLAGVPVPHLAAFVVAYGPVVAALLLSLRYDRMHWRWPFHKESVFGAFGFFIVAGWLTNVVPVYHFVLALCSP